MCTLTIALAAVASLSLVADAASIPQTELEEHDLVARAASDVVFDGCLWKVPGSGSFKKKVVYTFTGSSIPSGLYASGYTVMDTQSGAPYNHRFQTQNAYVSWGYLNLKVPGGQNPASDSEKAIKSAEIGTTESNILYASVRTKAIFGAAAGTCAGNFFYKTDNAEIDIEYLSDPTSLSNTGSQPNPIWYTNQKATSSSPSTSGMGPGLTNSTSAVNEWRIDWTSSSTKFFVNGNLQKTYTQNVPQVGGSWIWNNWSNGDKGWSVGPPTSDNIFKIQTIEMYYNVSGSTGCGVASQETT